MIDFSGLPAGETLSGDDFDFGPAGAPVSVSVRRGAGDGGSDRVTLLWRDYNPLDTSPLPQAVGNGWLTVTVKANARTGLTAPDVFSFGNLIGDTGDNATAFRVNAVDLAGVKRALNSTSTAAGRFDFNRDGKVNALDLGAVKVNLNRTLSPATTGGATSAGQIVPPVRVANLSDGSASHRVWEEAQAPRFG
jgi:hypothetical protein